MYKMKVCSCVLLFFSLKHFVSCNESFTEDAHSKSIFIPLAYLRYYNNRSDTDQIPVIFIPVIILPINMSQHDGDIQNAFDMKEKVKRNVTNEVHTNISEIENEDIEVNFRQSLNRGAKVPKKEENETDNDLSQINGNYSYNTATISNNAQNNETEMQNSDKIPTLSSNSHLYPIPNDDNKLVDSLALTTLKEEFKLPTVKNKQWKNFIISANNSTNKTSTSNNLTSNSETNRSKPPYSNALYNNAMIDQISITTNSYTNLESSTTEDDRWITFSTLGGPVIKPTGFKPLAGLYYDGFLNTPLIKMPGFNPHGNYYYP